MKEIKTVVDQINAKGWRLDVESFKLQMTAHAMDCYARSDASMEDVVSRFNDELDDKIFEDKVASLSWGGNHMPLVKFIKGITNRLGWSTNATEGEYIARTFSPRIKKGFIADEKHWLAHNKIATSPHWNWYWAWAQKYLSDAEVKKWNARTEATLTDPLNHPDDIYGKNSEKSRVDNFLNWLRAKQGGSGASLLQELAEDIAPSLKHVDQKCAQLLMDGTEPQDLPDGCQATVKAIEEEAQSQNELLHEGESTTPALEDQMATGTENADEDALIDYDGDAMTQKYRTELEAADGEDHESECAAEADAPEEGPEAPGDADSEEEGDPDADTPDA